MPFDSDCKSVILVTLVVAYFPQRESPVMSLSQRPFHIAAPLRIRQAVVCLVWMIFAACAGSVVAQSIDQSKPSAVQTNEVAGTIYARDLGDARFTDHFYAFTGTPGDLVITVEGNNLNGDIDVFTASGLRPLLKFSLYAGSSSPVSKSIYLRSREDLVLRVEARTPNDDAGTYRLRFGGSFEPITSGPLLAQDESDAQPVLTEPTVKKGRRVSSVGARIEEPPEPEVAAAPTPEPTPAEVESKPEVSEESKPSVTEESRPTASRPTPRRGRRVPGRRTRTPPPAVEEPPATESQPAESTEDTATTPAPPRRGSRRTAAARRAAEEAAAVQEPETGPRLVIETNDGTLINRYMSSVRRVTVERNIVMVVGKDGKIERFPLDTIVRMTIAP